MSTQMLARRLAAFSLLLGCCAALASTTEPGAANAAQASTATVLPRRRLASFCNTSAAALEQMVDSAKPQPCTEEQEQDSLNNLATELPDIGDVSQTIIDRSECNATDADGYTQAVDLFDFELIEVRSSKLCLQQGIISTGSRACMLRRAQEQPFSNCRAGNEHFI